MSTNGTDTTPPPCWRVDSNGYLLTQSGAKAARVVDGALLLWDKRTRRGIPFTLQDWFTATMTEMRGESHEPTD